ncbi:CRTAC1 family protein [Reichenbachiella agariperforans]|uniref:CRTAC1 family protein n=1 Tax=Reichenbachiella agariperforans TaxID=156994 RepID=UPI001C09032A|nr:CRTAC1 family protein [Reichenbachiella agariperforans]MBU2912634.1 CRTAC1 family protein [Reichenbachiella agariperforans]
MRKLVLIILPLVGLLMGCESPDNAPSEMIFQKLDASQTGVHFNNLIQENDTLNYYTYPYLYMGGGVATGDLNNDGLIDLFFTGNMTQNKLYLNRGDFRFEDITTDAGLSGDDRWYTGVTLADINADGWLDIYLCVSGIYGETANELWINNQDNTFTERAAEYGVDDESTSIQSSFFDYDRDGDLDLYVANYPQLEVSKGNEFYYRLMQKNHHEYSGHLYENKGGGSFVDVTDQSGVRNFGLSLGVVTVDFNQDGWQDIYVSNDFNVPDYFYINQRNGQFKEVLKESMGHTAMFGMGVDASDINNDGFIDLGQVDMTPSDHKRSKTNMASMQPDKFFEGVKMGFHYQYMHNALQLNQGVSADGIPQFSEVSQFAGMAKTDWSWSILFADFDNDSNQDIFISNGILRDVNNNDANLKFKEAEFFGAKKDYRQLPSTPLQNYLYQNTGNVTFSDVSKAWGMDEKGFSNGAAYADLNNDGKVDMLVHNINAPASIYQNVGEGANHYLQVRLRGSKGNLSALGAEISLYAAGTRQTRQLTNTRGFQSAMDGRSYFGLGQVAVVDSLIVRWPDGKLSQYEDIAGDQLLRLYYQEANLYTEPEHKTKGASSPNTVNFIHREDNYNDFFVEPLLPHRYSNLGPTIATGMVGDQPRVFIGNGVDASSSMYELTADEVWKKISGPWEKDSLNEDVGSILEDIDGDGDLDLLVVSGGNDPTKEDSFYQDRLYINVNGEFQKSNLPSYRSSGQSVLLFDFDGDQDQDVLIAGRVSPGQYPHPPPTVVLENLGGKDHELQFALLSTQRMGDLAEPGMVTDAAFVDWDQDGAKELLLTGEWLGVGVFSYVDDHFEHRSMMLKEVPTGWYGAMSVVDIDRDGDMDMVLGNLGLNYKYKASSQNPFLVFANDFDENGHSDIVLGYRKKGTLLPLRGRECSSQQVPAIKGRFKTYEAFADASLEDIYGEYMLENSLQYAAESFAHIWVENDSGVNRIHLLPDEAQWFSIQDIEVIDYNHDGYVDLMMGGNQLGSEVETSRNDAGMGLIIVGSQSGDLLPVSPRESGLMISGQTNAIGIINTDKRSYALFGVNDSPLQTYIYNE